MTREEAIEIIKRYDVNFCDNDGKPISAELLSQAFDTAIKSLEAWESLREELKYELCKKVHEKDSYIPCPNQTTSCSYIGLRIYELNNIINHVIDKHLKEVSE